MLNKKNGFSLIELVITIAIIAILICISFPLYTEHMVKMRRSNATIALTEIATRMEQYYAQNNSYSGANLNNLKVNNSGYKDFYKISIKAKDDNYTLKAQPIRQQAISDPKCGALILDQNGNKRITGSGDVDDCWP